MRNAAPISMSLLVMATAAAMAVVVGVGVAGLNTPFALVPGALCFAAAAAALVAGIRPMTVLSTCGFLLMVLDGDYNKYPTAISVWPRNILLTNFLVPGIPPPFEMTGFIVCGWMLLKNWRPGTLAPRGQKTFLLVAWLFPLAALLGGVVGLTHGGQIKVMYWQAHGILEIGAWAVAAYYACEGPADAIAFLDALVAGCIIKNVQNLWIYYVIQHGSLAGDEYLQSHFGSFYMATAMMALILRFATAPRGQRKIWHLIFFLTILNMWIANDRRSSMVGVLASLSLGLPLYRRFISKQQIVYGGASGVAVALFLAATWNMSGPLGKPAMVLKALSSHGAQAGQHSGDNTKEYADYRVKENYNSYTAVAKSPVLGTGYGFSFVEYIKLWELNGMSKEMHWINHNTVLMTWMCGGPFGLAAFATFIAFAVAGMVRLFRRTTERQLRIFAFIGFGVAIQLAIYTWSDQALIICTGLMVPSVFIGLAYKVLVMGGRSRNVPRHASRTIIPEATAPTPLSIGEPTSHLYF